MGDVQLQANGAYTPHRAYRASKQANRILSCKLDAALRAQHSRIVVNSMTPRLCQTRLAEIMGVSGGRPAHEGACTAVWLATSVQPAALEGGWHWRDEARRRCEFHAASAEEASTLVMLVEQQIQQHVPDKI